MSFCVFYCSGFFFLEAPSFIYVFSVCKAIFQCDFTFLTLNLTIEFVICFILAIDKYIYIFLSTILQRAWWSSGLRCCVQNTHIHTTGKGSNPCRNRQDFWPVKMLQTIFFCGYIYFTLLFKSLILNLPPG